MLNGEIELRNEVEALNLLSELLKTVGKLYVELNKNSIEEATGNLIVNLLLSNLRSAELKKEFEEVKKTLEEELSKVKKEYEDYKKSSEEKIKELESNINYWKERAEKADKQIITLTNANSDLNDKVHQLEGENANLRAEIEKLKNNGEIEILKSEIESLKTELEVRLREIEVLQQEKEELKSKLELSIQKITELMGSGNKEKKKKK